MVRFFWPTLYISFPTLLVDTATPSRVPAGCPGVQVVTRPNPAVPTHHQCLRSLSSSFCQCQRLHHPENRYSIGRQKILWRRTTSLQQSTQHSVTSWYGLWAVLTTKRRFCLSETVTQSWIFVFDAQYINHTAHAASPTWSSMFFSTTSPKHSPLSIPKPTQNAYIEHI